MDFGNKHLDRHYNLILGCMLLPLSLKHTCIVDYIISHELLLQREVNHKWNNNDLRYFGIPSVP